jgi:hypothetical protein
VPVLPRNRTGRRRKRERERKGKTKFMRFSESNSKRELNPQKCLKRSFSGCGMLKG